MTAKGETLNDLVLHGDKESQYVSIRYTQHFAKAGVKTSVVTAGDSYDNSLGKKNGSIIKNKRK